MDSFSQRSVSRESLTQAGDQVRYRALGFALIGSFLALLLLFPGPLPAQEQPLSRLEQLGKKIFFDPDLSDPPGQACAECHTAESGWTGNSSFLNQHSGVYPGALKPRFSNRKPPTASYASFSPVLHFDPQESLFIGGNFWDGRATGWLMGDPTAEQAQAPFLNPVEQNIKDARRVVELVCNSSYGELFRQVYGLDVCNNVVNAYNAIGKALSAFQSSREVNAFSSKYDYYLKDPQKYPLSEQERLGLEVFADEERGNCAACHPHETSADGTPPLFTDFTYDNLGFPKNPENPWYKMDKSFNPDGAAWVDPGLGGFLARVPRFAAYIKENLGKHKVPTLRNVDKRPTADFVKAYGHNGYFKTLFDIVHFYNNRDRLPKCSEVADPNPGKNCWPEPEVSENVNRAELGDLGLSHEEEMALVVFMQTLSDGWKPNK